MDLRFGLADFSFVRGSSVKMLSYLLAIVGVLALGYCAITFVRASRFQNRELRRFAKERQSHPRPTGDVSQSATPQALTRPYPEAGSVIAFLSIPRLDVSTMVVEGSEERQLALGAGHIPGTALPGEGGNVGIAGHRDTFFRPLRFIRTGDRIDVITREREYAYRVVSTQIVGPADIHVLKPAAAETITLVTCYPFQYVGAAPQRFIVRGERTN
jgi:sortase A